MFLDPADLIAIYRQAQKTNLIPLKNTKITKWKETNENERRFYSSRQLKKYMNEETR